MTSNLVYNLKSPMLDNCQKVINVKSLIDANLCQTLFKIGVSEYE